MSSNIRRLFDQIEQPFMAVDEQEELKKIVKAGAKKTLNKALPKDMAAISGVASKKGK